MGGAILHFGRPFDGEPSQGSTNLLSSGTVYDALHEVHPELTMDAAPVEGSLSPVTSGGLYTLFAQLTQTIAGLTVRVAELEEINDDLTARIEDLEDGQATVDADGYAVL